MPDIKRLHWLEDLLRIEGFGYPGVKFAGIYLVDKVNEPNVFGCFAEYRDHEREHEQFPFIDGIYISDAMNEGNPLHELCTGAHEVGHWKLLKDGQEYRDSESWAKKYAELFLMEFFTQELATEICEVHTYGEDPCRLSGVKERAEILAVGSERERAVGTRILAYLKRKPRAAKARIDTSVGLDKRIANLSERLAGG